MNRIVEKNLFLLLIVSLFIQLWFNIAGFTLRLEDLIGSIFLVVFLLRIKNSYRIKSLRLLDKAILGFCFILILAIGNTFIQSYPLVYKKDALINGVRIIYCFLSFYLAYDLVKQRIIRLEHIIKIIIGISFLTTSVAVLQILHWDGLLPFSLPSILTTLKEGANVERGREIFALYIGDTGSHKWSAMLSVQILLVFFYLKKQKKKSYKAFMISYLVVLFYILLRISVRNSILGVILAIIAVLFLTNMSTRQFKFKNVAKALGVLITSILALVTVISLLPEDNYYVQRFLVAIPSFDSGGLEINRASNIVGRLYYWFFAWSLFISSPFIGTGLYSYEYLSLQEAVMPTVHAHNSYFNYLAETGLVGFGALIFLLIIVFKKVWNLQKVPFTNNSFLVLRDLLLASFIFIIFTSFFGNTLYQTPELMIRFILLGSVLAFINSTKVYVKQGI